MLVVMLTALTWPTLAALILSLVVLCPGPSTSVPEPWLETYSSSPPVGGTVTCTYNGQHAGDIQKAACIRLMTTGTLQANGMQHMQVLCR